MNTVQEFIGTVPSRRQSQAEFNTNLQAILVYLVSLAPEINIVVAEMNNAAVSASGSAAEAEASKDAALATSGASIYSGAASYDYPDAVIGSDGNTYRCVGAGVTGDDPVGSISGNWHRITPAANDYISFQSLFYGGS